MKRKVILLNAVLAGLIVSIGWRLHSEWVDQKARELAVRRGSTKPAPPPVVKVSSAPAPVTAANYSAIAQKMLFSKERNPDIVVEAPAKPVPPLPLLHGILGLPSGALALLSVNDKTRSMGVRVGDKIGDFQLASLTEDEISFKWEDKTVTKSVLEMMRTSEEKTSSQQAAAPAPSAGPAVNTPSSAPAAGSARPHTDVAGSGGAIKTCTPGDNSPDGTVADGYKKVLVPTPFGNSCHWEQIK